MTRTEQTRLGGTKQARLDEFEDAGGYPVRDPLDVLDGQEREVYRAVGDGDQDPREYAAEVGESVGAVAELAANARDRVESYE